MLKDIDYTQENSLKKNTDCVEDAFQMGLLDRFEIKEPDVNKKPNFTFIDLFAGIGGFHLAASNLGGKCVFASELDDNARKTYEANFLKHNKDLFYSGNFAGNIIEVDAKDIPDFDFLFAGFPCQPFSIAGHRQGFDDKNGRGNLFFNIVKILKEKNQKSLFLRMLKILKHTAKVIQSKVNYKS